MKDDLSQKNTRKYDNFFKLSGRMVFSKRTAPGHDLSYTIWENGTFSQKHDIFSLGWKVRDDLSQEIYGIWHFLCTRTSVTNVAPRPSAKKEIKDGLIPQKYILHLKVIEVLDWHPRKSSSNSLSFHGDLHRRFHALFSSEKETGNLIYRIEVWLILKFIRW